MKQKNLPGRNLLIIGSVIALFLIAFAASYLKSASNSVLGASTSTKTREAHIFLGMGSSTGSDWTDVSGAHAYIDAGAYGKIISAAFDATLRVPTGNQKVWVRLFNTTGKHPVWNSEMSMDGIGPTIRTTSKISLDKGTNLYQVQIKNQLNFPTFLDSSRIRMLFE
jgi:hypothetical protein